MGFLHLLRLWPGWLHRPHLTVLRLTSSQIEGIRWWCFDRWVNSDFLDFFWNVPICHVPNRLYWFCICHDQWIFRVIIRAKTYVIHTDSQTSSNCMRTNKLIELEYSTGASSFMNVNYPFLHTTTQNMKSMLRHWPNGHSFGQNSPFADYLICLRC